MTAQDFGLPAGTLLAKAHGTGNTFVMLDDPAGTIEITAEQVAALCSPTHGIGADGFIRCTLEGGTWFMDYRNSDGSIAEMCGNGVRAFVNHLRRRNFVTLAVGEVLPVQTRGGLRSVRIEEPLDGVDQYAVDMGPAVTTGSVESTIVMPGLDDVFDAVHVAMPNPHAVIDVREQQALQAAILATTDAAVAPVALRPVQTPPAPEGVNIELTVDVSTEEDLAQGRGRLLMRVLERGVGETASCGTGCCAAAVAAAIRRQQVSDAPAPRRWQVTIPGGVVEVDLGRDAESSVTLIGPAAHIADIVV